MSGLAAAYDCGTLWTFLIVVFKLHCYLKCDTFFVAHYPYNSSNVCITIDCYTVLLKVSRQITKHSNSIDIMSDDRSHLKDRCVAKRSNVRLYLILIETNNASNVICHYIPLLLMFYHL